MDWLSIARSLAPIAPTLLGFVGKVIPIPGASIALEFLGTGIARALGVPATPEAVNNAIANANDLEKTKILAVLEEAKAKWAAGTEQERVWAHVVEVGVAEVNATMRAELDSRLQLTLQSKKEHWFFTAPRPAIMWEFVLFAGVFGLLLSIAGFHAVLFGDDRGLKIIQDVWQPFAAFFVVLGAVCGIYIPNRTSEKNKAMEVGTTATLPQVVKPSATSGR
jgi:hypothetical protein